MNGFQNPFLYWCAWSSFSIINVSAIPRQEQALDQTDLHHLLSGQPPMTFGQADAFAMACAGLVLSKTELSVSRLPGA
eukprot:1161976-Pelagomonas_calceolata.AAC.14